MNFLVRAADRLGKWTARWVPSSFAIAVLLTLLTALLALLFTDSGPQKIFEGWGGGLWTLLKFSMQMALIMFSGYLLALTRPVRFLLEKIASFAKSPRSAVLVMALASMGLAYINWGLSIVASAMLVRFIVKKQPEVDYRLLVACAYFGLGATWHAGLSASAPLLVATSDHFLVKQIGVVPLSETLFSPFNLLLIVVTVSVLAFLAWAMHPKKEHAVKVEPRLLLSFKDFEAPARPSEKSPASAVDFSPALNVLLGGAGIFYVLYTLARGGMEKLDLDLVNVLFLSSAILLHKTPTQLLKAAEEAGMVLSGIVLQFPLYAGMYGIFDKSGLTDQIGHFFVSISTTKTFPAIVYVYSGIVNYFVPSGGAKWSIEAPYLITAAKTLNVPASKVVLAYAWGDMATDLIQPFWALPLLSVAKLEFKDVLGFLLLTFLVYVPLVTAAFLIFG